MATSPSAVTWQCFIKLLRVNRQREEQDDE
jgi:hypothetical protein